MTRRDDAEHAIALGVDAIGLNLWPRSPRSLPLDAARSLLEAIAHRVRVVAVVVDAEVQEIATLHAAGFEWIQLHDFEPREGSGLSAAMEAALPRAYRAFRLKGLDDVARALAAPGDEVLIDAHAASAPGGTGELADEDLARQVITARRTWLAGGLRPENVRARVASLSPFGVDVASGVESAPGLKDPALVEAFVRAVRG